MYAKKIANFLNDAKDKGGHVLGLTMENGEGSIDTIQEFDMILPQSESFANMNFSENMTAKIKSVE